jgi:ABC-type lipoprotein release transport system permease subunit
MTWIRVFLSRCSTLFRGTKFDGELEDEVWETILRGVMATAACLLPALRAAHLDAVCVLRAE